MNCHRDNNKEKENNGNVGINSTFYMSDYDDIYVNNDDWR